MKLRMLLINLNDKNLRELYEQYKNAIYLFILSIVKNAPVAEDLTQEVYIKIIKYHKSYNPMYNPKTWIFQIAKNTCYTYLKNNNEIPYDLNILLDKKYSTNIDESYLIRDYLSKISDIDQKIILLHIYAGLKHSEIAKLLNLTPNNTKVRYHNALKKLEKELKNEKN